MSLPRYPMTLAELAEENLPGCVPCEATEDCMGSYHRVDGRVKFIEKCCPYLIDLARPDVSAYENPIVGVIFRGVVHDTEGKGSDE